MAHPSCEFIYLRIGQVFSSSIPSPLFSELVTSLAVRIGKGMWAKPDSMKDELRGFLRPRCLDPIVEAHGISDACELSSAALLTAQMQNK